jgi:hypothetical protein
VQIRFGARESSTYPAAFRFEPLNVGRARMTIEAPTAAALRIERRRRPPRHRLG